jgi:hypothetical protein
VTRELAAAGRCFMWCRGSSGSRSTRSDPRAGAARAGAGGARADARRDARADDGGLREHRADVLVSTAIIESGLDIPRANTMFIAHAEQFGLAQLYQLRGRVGRSEAAGALLPDGAGARAAVAGGAAPARGGPAAQRAGLGLRGGGPRPRDPRRRRIAGGAAERADPGDRLRRVRADLAGGGGRAARRADHARDGSGDGVRRAGVPAGGVRARSGSGSTSIAGCRRRRTATRSTR